MDNIQDRINNDEVRKMVEKRVKDILDATDTIKEAKTKHKEREKMAESAFEKDASDINGLVLVRIYILNQKLSKATVLVNQMLISEPDNVLAKKEQLRIFLKQKHYSVVESEVEKILLARRESGQFGDEVDIDTLDFKSYLLDAYLNQSKLVEAEKLALEIDSVDLNDKGRIFKIVNEVLANIYRQNGDIVNYEKRLRNLCDNQANNVRYALELAICLEKQGNLEEAYSILIQLPKPNHEVRTKISWLQRKLGKNNSSVENNSGKSSAIPKSLKELRKELITRVLSGEVMLEDIPIEKENLEKKEKKKLSEVAIILAEVYMLLRSPEMAERCIRQALRSEDIQGNAEVIKKLRQVLDFTQRRKPVFDGLIGDRFNVIHGEK